MSHFFPPQLFILLVTDFYVLYFRPVAPLNIYLHILPNCGQSAAGFHCKFSLPLQDSPALTALLTDTRPSSRQSGFSVATLAHQPRDMSLVPVITQPPCLTDRSQCRNIAFVSQVSDPASFKP